jgi:hypothetical protein
VSVRGRKGSVTLTALWRECEQPAAAHDLAERLLSDAEYARTRGVAQQAARLARPTHLARPLRQRLLSAAWLHRLGAEPLPAVDAARSIRLSGQEDLARVVACAGPTPELAALLDAEPVVREFPWPVGDGAVLLALLEIAVVTTDLEGARTTPAGRLRSLVTAVGSDAPSVRAFVRVVSRIGEDAPARALLELVCPKGVTP